MQTVRVVRSALFVDFDNLYSGLKDADATAAHRFATIPQHWLSWLSQGIDEDGLPFRRRFLSKNCYLNPGPYGGFRSFYASSGFRVVDCPSLTRAGKSSADIHLALDVVDALNHPTRYDEFIVCSADADFTPVMVRLRAHDRRTVMVAAGVTAAAYDAACDESIETTAFVEALQRPLISADATTLGNGDATYTAPSPADDTSENNPQQLRITTKEAAPAVAAIRAAVKESQVPITGAAAAHAARRAAPEVAARWAGAGGFLNFAQQRVPELRIVRSAGGGWIFDPRRHTPFDIPGAQDDDITTQVCRVTKAPRLTAQQFAVVFEELEADLRQQPFNLTATSVSVRNRTAERGTPLGRGAINFVLQGLVYCGVNFEQDTLPARELARVTRDNLVTLCRTAQMQLTEDNLKDIDDWVVGGLT